MCMRSNYKIVYFELFFYSGIIAIIAICLILHQPKNFENVVFPIILCGIGLLLIAYEILRYWIAFGREIQLTKEGCNVSFLWFKKFYTWDQMKTKRVTKVFIGGRVFRLCYNGLLLSNKKVWLLETKIFYGLTFNVPTYHPFSLVFVLFEPNLLSRVQSPNWFPKWMKQELDSGYFADEEELFSLLNSWGVSVDGK